MGGRVPLRSPYNLITANFSPKFLSETAVNNYLNKHLLLEI